MFIVEGTAVTYREYLKNNRDLVAMIHVQALPGTPQSRLSPGKIIDRAVEEARLYRHLGYKTVMIENMHDIPYTLKTGGEITGIMAIIGEKIKNLGIFCGTQILAACNEEAMGVAHSAGLDFIRAEGYVFGHVADEGYIQSCAGNLKRYQRLIGASDVMIFTDIKKKHSAHAVTADVSLLETAKAAGFFLSDGIVVTGTATGEAVVPDDMAGLRTFSGLKVIGSGLTDTNIQDYIDLADVFIVGSYLKIDELWANDPDPARAKRILNVFQSLTE